MSYINVLPYEMVRKILHYLDSGDMIEFLITFPEFQSVFKEKPFAEYAFKETGLEHLISPILFFRNINFHRRFHTIDHLPKYLRHSIDLSLVKIFNINSIYWVSEDDLLEILSKMNNLHTLLALDTQLDVCESHCDVFNRLPLQKVALTLDFQQNPMKNVYLGLSSVKELCLKYAMFSKLLPSVLIHLYFYLQQCTELKELMVSGYFI